MEINTELLSEQSLAYLAVGIAEDLVNTIIEEDRESLIKDGHEAVRLLHEKTEEISMTILWLTDSSVDSDTEARTWLITWAVEAYHTIIN
jgi:hypothetical protein